MDEPRPGRPPSITRRAGRGGGRGDAGADAGERDALVAGVDGRAQRTVASPRSAGSGGRSASSPTVSERFKLSTDPLFVEKVYDVVGLYLNPPETGGGAVRGREVPGPGPGPVPAGVADDARHARAPHPRLRPPRHHQPVRRAEHRRRHGDLQPAPPAPRDRVPKFLAKIDSQVPERSRRAPGLRQLRHPQDPGDPHLAGAPPPLPHALHPDRLVVDQPGRAVGSAT